MGNAYDILFVCHIPSEVEEYESKRGVIIKTEFFCKESGKTRTDDADMMPLVKEKLDGDLQRQIKDSIRKTQGSVFKRKGKTGTIITNAGNQLK
ncbi:hypothetical protein SAMN02746066_00367 [Anaerosporobacter mobilis DSM 15930]|jgi:acetylglutamate kinase|uniref:Uncharacterized protein n=1 Tax=Anaerosporobacter mobilis DSM 15930 TaxID=1120996 RepID=A0A1M7F2K1_9FIRM|nr:hypothetical protein [Anaerosporobacter mobilis]SHL98322.1 hypothetical protein SAMN02746066_00367 [Anaerosporobacter mobilis DSM 15930]